MDASSDLLMNVFDQACTIRKDGKNIVIKRQHFHDMMWCLDLLDSVEGEMIRLSFEDLSKYDQYREIYNFTNDTLFQLDILYKSGYITLID